MKLIWQCTILLLLSCSAQPGDNWIQLFNGKDLRDWTAKFSGFEAGVNYKNTFSVENGILKVSYDAYDTFDDKFGHLFYKDKFSHYKLRAEYRFVGEQVAGGPQWAFRNNGLMLHCQAPQTVGLDQDFPVSVEVQLLGDDGTANRPCGNPCTPGSHIMEEDSLITEHCPSFSNKTADADTWHTMEVVVKGSTSFTHILDGDTVAYYEKPQFDPDDPTTEQFLGSSNHLIGEGYIAIQAESHPTEFRKIELLVLN